MRSVWLWHYVCWLLLTNGEEEQVALLVTFAQKTFHGVNALAEFDRRGGLSLLHVFHQSSLASGNASSKVIDEESGSAAKLGGGQGDDVIRRDGVHGLWKKHTCVHM